MYHTNLWSINNAGWKVERSKQSISISPCNIDGALTIGTFYDDSFVGSIEEVLPHVVQKGAPLSAERVRVTCGDFVGFRAEYEDDDAYWRVWWLFSGSGRVHIYAIYNCDREYVGLHNAVVTWMMNSLKANA